MTDKFMEKNEEFAVVCNELLSQFSAKNKHYGNDYFEGEYSELERWLSVRRKIARLQTYYSGENKQNLPDETLIDTWMDLAIYAIMELIILKGGKNKNEKNK